MQELGKQAEKVKDKGKFARDHFGIKAEPIFDFEIEVTIPCLLHVLMALGRKMLKMIVAEANGNSALEQRLEAVLVSLKVKLKDTDKGLQHKIKKSRLGRPEFIRIMRHHSLLLDELAAAAKSTGERNHIARIRPIWRSMVQLLALLSTEERVIPEAFWRKKALEFAAAFVKEYDATDVTPYLHVFVYHIGYYTENYGCLERLANYGIEGLHKKNKQVVRRASSGFKAGPKVAQQQLQHHFRSEYHRKGHISEHQVEKHRRKGESSWKDAKLELEDEFKQYLTEYNKAN